MVEGTPGTAFCDEIVIERVRFANDTSGFAVGDADRDGDELVLVGPLAHLERGGRAQVEGTWQDDERFGLQVRVTAALPLAPAGDDALLAYLRRVRHVGLTRAAALLDRHGEGVLAAIDADPAT